jgi:16S rRNA (cytosine1402-N4)-methyltransferase
MSHTPVLLAETLQHLTPERGGVFVDGTLGGGGHTQELFQALPQHPDTRLIGIDRDPDILARTTQTLHASGIQPPVFQPRHGTFDQLIDWVTAGDVPRITGGLLLDLGVSSFQLDERERGFSFRHDAPLDMRMDQTSGITAGEFLAQATAERLRDILFTYGEERLAGPITRAVLQHRDAGTLPQTTHALADLVRHIYRRHGFKDSRVDPATKTFQALRIAVNDELGCLERLLTGLPTCLKPGARVAIITFHSLEDRLVKQAFAQWARACVCPPQWPACQCRGSALATLASRKPIAPSPEEVASNPRARSAKLRGIEWLGW